MAKNNELINLTINVSGDGNLKIKQMNKDLNNTEDNAQDASKSVGKIGDSASDSKKQVSGLSSSMSGMVGIIGGLSLGALAGEILQVSAEWNKLNAIISATSNNAEKTQKDFQTIFNFKGISNFAKEDIAEVYNLLRSQNIGFTEEIFATIADTSLSTSQNIVTVAEQYRAVLNLEQGTLDDYFKKVTKTSEGMIVQYTDKSGELKTILLKDQEDLTNALNDQYKGVLKNINETASGQAKILKEQFFNVLSEEFDELFVSTVKFYQASYNEIKKTYDDIKNLFSDGEEDKKTNLYGFSDEEVTQINNVLKLEKERVEVIKKETELNVKNNISLEAKNSLLKDYENNLKNVNSVEALGIEQEKLKVKLKEVGSGSNEQILTDIKRIELLKRQEIAKANQLIIDGKIDAINKQIEILTAGENKRLIILKESQRKELEGIINPEIISAIKNKHDIEIGLLEDKLLKEEELIKQRAAKEKQNQLNTEKNVFQSKLSDLGPGFVDDEALNENERNQRKLEDIATYYDDKQELLTERLAAEYLTKQEQVELEVELEQSKSDRILAIQQEMAQNKTNNLLEIQNGLGAMQTLFSTFDQAMGGQSKKSFEAQKVLAIAQATINTYMAASNALATGGPFLGPVLAGISIATGLAQVSTIASQQYTPKYHDGGIIKNGGSLSNEIDATLQTGEGVLSRRGMGALDKLNRGESGSNSPQEIIIVSNMEEAIKSQLTSRSGRALIKEIK